jgi:hypothetical protein
VVDVDGGTRRSNRDFGGGGGSSGGGGGSNLPFDVLRIHGACRAKMTGNLSNNKKKRRGGSCQKSAVKTAVRSPL